MASKSTIDGFDFNKFYEFEDPFATRPFRLRTAPESKKLSVEDVYALAHGRLRLDSPIKLVASSGGQATDFLWSELPPLVCISSRVVDLLTTNDCTGWSTYPVEVYDRQGNLLPGYHGFVVTGPECRRDKSRSEIVEKPPPAPRGRSYKVYKGLYFDEHCWDGSDFFWVVPFGGRIISEKVYRLFRKHKVRNIELTPLLDVEIKVLFDEFEKP